MLMEDQVCHLNGVAVSSIPFEVRASWSWLTSSFPDHFDASKLTLIPFRLLSYSFKMFCLLDKSSSFFMSFPTEFLQFLEVAVFDRSQAVKDKFRLVISEKMSNCFHPLASKTLFLIIRQHKYCNEVLNQT